MYCVVCCEVLCSNRYGIEAVVVKRFINLTVTWLWIASPQHADILSARY
jgi:hypothetical protein